MCSSAGRSAERPVLSDEQIEANVAGIRATLEDLLSDRNGSGPAPVILNNLVRASMACCAPGNAKASETSRKAE